jgi:GT2 family glycosyltransferase
VRLDVAVPTLGLSSHLADLLAMVRAEGPDLVGSVTLYVNDDSEACRQRVGALGVTGAAVEWFPGHSIYHEWNVAADRARAADRYLALLTDDVVLAPGVLATLVDWLDRHPEYGLITPAAAEPYPHVEPTTTRLVTPSDGRRELAQWCLVVRPAAWPGVDERFRVWYGDDDLIWKTHAAGWQLAVLYGVGVGHHTSTTISQLDWVGPAIEQDQRLWASLGR